MELVSTDLFTEVDRTGDMGSTVSGTINFEHSNKVYSTEATATIYGDYSRASLEDVCIDSGRVPGLKLSASEKIELKKLCLAAINKCFERNL